MFQFKDPDSIPLAHRLRPARLIDFVGQRHLLDEGKPLALWLKQRRMPSILLWGPPGVGKTTLAHLIALELGGQFKVLSAVQTGVKEMREVCEAARSVLTLLFIDEIHRLNKGQQDVLLPYVERGDVTLIGATTENPSFEINAALLSRMRVLRLELISVPDVIAVLKRATETCGWNHPEEALERIARRSQGDLRRALTLLQSVGPARADEELLAALESNPALRYDKAGEEHYDTISAFIKCMRASDANAAVYYLARMLEGGEDPLFIARRMVIFASEDIGHADPRALLQAMACQQAVDFVGMPEARIVLSQTVIYLARAKKDRSAYDAIGAALEEVKRTGARPIPMHLRNAVTGLMKAQGYGKADGVSSGNLPGGLERAEFFKAEVLRDGRGH